MTVPSKGNILAWMFLPLRRYGQFSGRSGRREFWWFSAYLTLSYCLVLGILITAIGFTEGGFDETDIDGRDQLAFIVFMVLWAIIFIGNFVPGLALTSRRFQDMGLPGWLVVVALLVVFFFNVLGWIGYMIVMSLPAQKGENQYGPPVYDDQIADVFC